MRTAGEIDSKDRIVRIFHRTSTASRTHAPGERYRYRTRTKDENGRNVMGWVEVRCGCEVSESANGPSDAGRRSSGPGAKGVGTTRPQDGGADPDG